MKRSRFNPTPRTNPARPARGFTLLELLVVVAVIAILAGLLLPALSRGKQAAQSIRCGSQLRQIGIATRLYADDNDDQFPRSQHSAFTHGERPWGRAIAAQLSQPASNWTNLLTTVYRCPADRRSGSWSYGQNVYYELDPAADDYTGSPKTWRRFAAVPHPSASILHAENTTAADHIMPQFWQNAVDGGEVAQTRHGRQSNYGFVDGHVHARQFGSTYAPEKQVDAWNPSLAQ